MIELSNSTIDKACKFVRTYFPSTLILDVFRDVVGNTILTNFPEIELFEGKIVKTRKVGMKITLKVVNETSAYFCEKQDLFLVFLTSLTSQSICSGAVNRIMLDEFISKINTLLIKDSKMKIENYKTIQLWLPNKAGREVFLNINVPEHIQDYFIEALDCVAYELHRSSILFSTFALESSLRYKYSDMVGNTKSISFYKLIKWAIENNLIEENEFNKTNIDFIRDYRNDIVHSNIGNQDEKWKISRSYAQKMSKIVLYLVELFINNIFYDFPLLP